MKLHSESLQQKIEDKDKDIHKLKSDVAKLKEEFSVEKQLLNQIIDGKDQELKKQRQVIEMRSNKALEIDQSAVIPNTAKSYFNQQIGNRRSSGRSKAGNSNITESVEMIKKTFGNPNNVFNATAATSNQFNSTESCNSKHKRSKTQNCGGNHIKISFHIRAYIK